MESPPSTSIWSEAFILSDDSGLLLTSGSVSSGSMSGGLGQLPLEYQDSDKSDSLDGMSDIICGEHYNTLKKGPPHWIEPPPQFQDRPNVYDAYAELLAESVIREVLEGSRPNRVNVQAFRPVQQRTYWLPFSPCHGGRPSSRSSLGSSRLSSSHNSLAVTTAHHADDSSFITQAVSHDTLSSVQISDLYNVPFDSDVYALPVDTVRPPTKPRRQPQQQKRRRRNTASGFRELEQHARPKRTLRPVERVEACKRHSVAGTSADAEPVHMTLQEVRTYLQTLYSSSSDSEHKDNIAARTRTAVIISNNNNNKYSSDRSNQPRKKSTFLINIKNKKVKDSCDSLAKQQIEALSPVKQDKRKTTRVFSIKQTLCNMFRFRRILPSEHEKAKKAEAEGARVVSRDDADCNRNITRRALPPLPGQKKPAEDSPVLDFATSIRKVKDYGWYWGPLSSEGAEKILSNEPDGSFIVRDSSDDHYIFSLTFKLNNTVRHVRIEHDQGNFSFGSCTKFKSQTIIEFIENAVEHSRSGRYLFFLHRRPTIGPVRVQLLHPVSRFKQTQSLQHMCRFVILKKVRKDLIPSLPLPRRMIDYLSTPHYYSEHLIDIEEEGERVRTDEWESSGEEQQHS